MSLGRLERDRLRLPRCTDSATNQQDPVRNCIGTQTSSLHRPLLVSTCRAQLDGAASSMGVTAWGVDVGLLDNHNRLVAPIQHYRAADPQDAQRLHQLGAEELFVRTGVLPAHQHCVSHRQDSGFRRFSSQIGGRQSVARARPVVCASDWRPHRGAVDSQHRPLSPVPALGTRSYWMLSASTPRSFRPSWTTALWSANSARSLRKIGARDQWPFVLVASHDTGLGRGGGFSSPQHCFRILGHLVDGRCRAGWSNRHQRRVGCRLHERGGTRWTTLFMRNLTGLWLLEQAMRQWQDQGQEPHDRKLVDEAVAVGPLWAAFDVSSPELVSSEDVLRTVRMQCTSTDMAPPETPAEVARCILQSLALTYRRTVNLCEQLTGRSVTEVHMIGGGSLNPLLRRLTADACGRLRFGPVEATSLGSLAAQAVAVGDLSDEADAQAVLQRAPTQNCSGLPTTKPYDASGSNWITPSPLPGATHDFGTRPYGSGTAVPDAREPARRRHPGGRQHIPASRRRSTRRQGHRAVAPPPRQKTLSWSV